MKLHDIEAGLQRYVLGQETDIAGEIAGPDEAYRLARLDIYRDAYRLRLLEVLGSDYPVLKAHSAGEFESVAKDYLAANPSTFRNVRWFGENLATFLRAHPQYSTRPAFAELAEFEWTLGLAFDAADAPPITFDEVAAVAPGHWPELRFDVHPSLSVLKLRAASVAIWQAANGSPTAGPGDGSANVDWAVWRKGLSPHFRSLDKNEAWALAALREGRPFADICAGLCDRVSEADAARWAAHWLRIWVDEGWIVALRLS